MGAFPKAAIAGADRDDIAYALYQAFRDSAPRQGW